MNGPHVKFAYDVLISLRECLGNSYVFRVLLREVRRVSLLTLTLTSLDLFINCTQNKIYSKRAKIKVYLL